MVLCPHSLKYAEDTNNSHWERSHAAMKRENCLLPKFKRALFQNVCQLARTIAI